MPRFVIMLIVTPPEFRDMSEPPVAIWTSWKASKSKYCAEVPFEPLSVTFTPS